MINALGFAGNTEQPTTSGSIAETGLVHCALISRLLRASSASIDANATLLSTTNTASKKEAELLLAQYNRYDGSSDSDNGRDEAATTETTIKAKL